MAAAGTAIEERLSLRDGSRVLIRAVRPEDRELIARGLERLSVQSRYRRFHSPVARLSSAQLDYLTVLDHHDHEALIALDETSGEAAGVARFVRLSAEVAECAVTVGDAWQGLGLGGRLLDLLVERAREEGVERFAASVLADNEQALALLERLGPTVRRGGSGPAVELEIALPEPGGERTLRELLRANASGALTPAVQLWRLVVAAGGGRRRGGAGDERTNAVVVPIPRGETGRRAMAAAAAIARARGGELHVVAAWWPLLRDRLRAEGELGAAVAEVTGEGIPAEGHLESGALAQAVLDVAADVRAGLIVVDARAEEEEDDGLDRLADRISHHAPCDALLVRP